ncbi:MAG: sensor histidine kinase [Planctomycetota bacterium]
MSLRFKIFLATFGFMLLTTAILTLSLVLHALNQYQNYKKSFSDSIEQVVENWVATALPDSLDTPAKLIGRLDALEGQFFPRDAGNAPRRKLFDEIVLMDRYRQVVRVVAPADAPERPAIGSRLYDPPLEPLMRDARTQIKDEVVYKPLMRKRPLGSDMEIAWVLRMRLDLEIPAPMEIGQLMAPVLWVMLLGTIALLLSLFFLLSRLVLKPIEQLAGVSQSIARGDYTRRVAPPETTDEIGDLVHAFNRMMQEVHEHRSTLQQKIDDSVRQARKAEQRLVIAQRLAATGTLAAGIAHEINNPIAGMQNAVQRLQKKLADTLDPRSKEYFELIEEGLERVQGIVRQVLDVSRRRVNPEPFDMTDPVRRSAEFVMHRARRYDVKLEIAPPEGTPPMCFGDRGEINQVLTNLLVNAIDAVRDAREQDKAAGRTDVREGLVRVTWKSTPEGISTTVSDTGCGMTDEQASRAFDAFYTTKQDGTGLGLAIIHNIIESHGGSIEIASEVGKGTDVTFVVPRVLED